MTRPQAAMWSALGKGALGAFLSVLIVVAAGGCVDWMPHQGEAPCWVREGWNEGCGAQRASSCFAEDGCRLVSECRTNGCGGIEAESECEGIDGCKWSEAGHCSAECDQVLEQLRCEKRAWCQWKDEKCSDISGSAACRGSDEAGCRANDACNWKVSCAPERSVCIGVYDRQKCEKKPLACIWGGD